jgi:hypothetical protein
LEERPFGFVFVAFEVGIDANPVHLAAAGHLLFADNRNIVFGLAGDHAGVAADTTIQVNRHPPGVTIALVLVIEIRIERQFL